MADSSPYYCSPPFHPDPGHTMSTRGVYLVTCPQARSPGPGIYTSWLSSQRVVTGISHGVAVGYPSVEACLPAWHAGCDAGEHEHPASPSLQRGGKPQPPKTPRKPTESCPPVSPFTGRGRGSFKKTPRCGHATTAPMSPTPAARVHVVPNSTTPTFATKLLPTVAAARIPTSSVSAPAPELHFAVRGGGVVHSSLTSALDEYKAAAMAGSASVCTITDTRTAAHFAAGHSLGQARAMAAGENALIMYEQWGDGPSGEPAVCRLRRDQLVDRLTAALEALRVGDVAQVDNNPGDSDFEDLSDDDRSSVLTYISD
ncbi:hypothetical protein C8R44DRAFT_885420 [Mycena epipterygia]|nr:hypothetical protein C8R44DRAFT_885420 [Mycena epipterygia]